MSKKPITLYWSPGSLENDDKSFYFNKPNTVFSNLIQHRNKKNATHHIFACPAFSEKYKKMLAFTCPLSCEYEYNFSDDNKEIKSKTENYIPLEANIRPDMFNYGPNFLLDLGPIFFADEPLTMNITPPYFHKPGYTKYGSVVPGQYDIGQWFRPVSFEIQMWNNYGNLVLTEDEPLFYAEFQTDRPIELKRFLYSPLLARYVKASTDTTHNFGRGQSLLKRYQRFKNVGMREKILTEIKKNIIEEDPFIF